MANIKEKMFLVNFKKIQKLNRKKGKIKKFYKFYEFENCKLKSFKKQITKI